MCQCHSGCAPSFTGAWCIPPLYGKDTLNRLSYLQVSCFNICAKAVSSSAVISGADDVEKGGSNNEIKEESKEEKYNYKDINSRLRQFTKADLLYSVAGYSGGILIGALPGKDKYILS